jgi:hypothetical protein
VSTDQKTKYAFKVSSFGGNFITKKGDTFFEVTNSDDALQRSPATLKRIGREYYHSGLYRWAGMLDIVPVQ